MQLIPQPQKRFLWVSTQQHRSLVKIDYIDQVDTKFRSHHSVCSTLKLAVGQYDNDLKFQILFKRNEIFSGTTAAKFRR